MDTQPIQKWYSCEKCNKVESYWLLPDGTTTFPRGEWLGHNDYITTDFPSQELAQQWLDEHVKK